MANFILAFLLAFSITVLLVPFVRTLSMRLGAVDMPNARKIHSQPLPRLGGIALFLGFVVPLLLLLPLNRPFLGLLGGVAVIFIVGLIDDIKGLGPWTKLWGQILAAGVVLAGGIGIIAVTDPVTGGVIPLDPLRIPMEVAGFEFNIIPLANAVSILWILVVMNTVNFLDGMDGLAAGVVGITALVIGLIAAFALAPTVEGIEVGLLAAILVGACAGFLIFNWHPSSLIMGDSGSYTIGLVLAVMAIYGGAKFGVGILVLGVALADMVWAIVRRLYHRKPLFSPDRGHIHHQLLDSGLTQVQVVLHLYAVAVGVGVAVLLGGVWPGVAALLIALALTALRVKRRRAAASI